MKALQTFWSRIRALWPRRAVKQEIDEELRFHLEQRTEENIVNGMAPDAAAREARKQFGNLQRVREECRDTKGASLGETLWQDVRFGLRMLGKNLGFTVVAVGIFAVGIAANVGVFSLVDTVLLRPLPVPAPEELVAVAVPSHGSEFSTASYQTLRAQRATFRDMTAYEPASVLCRAGNAQTRIPIEYVKADYFPFLGLTPHLGRLLSPSDAHTPYVVISDRCWQREFNRDPDVVGRVIHINDKPFTIVGVAGPDFSGMTPMMPVDAWLPAGMKGAIEPGWKDRPQYHWLYVVGRLKPGVSIQAAQASLQAIQKDVLAPWILQSHGHLELVPCRGVIPGSEGKEGQAMGRLIATFLLSVMALVLAVACANVASLLLSRGVNRRREIAMRLALGASRWRLVQQLLTETLLLSLLGGAAGLLLSAWAVHLLTAVLPTSVTGVSLDFSFRFDWRVALYALLLSAATALVCGLVPALQSTRLALQPTLKDETPGMTIRTRWYDLRNVFMAVQVALCVVLLVGGGLMLRSLNLLHKTDFGFDYRDCLTASVWNRDKATSESEYVERLSELVHSAKTLPGVLDASVCNLPPLGVAENGTSIAPEDNRSQWTSVMRCAVTPAFFDTLGIRLLRGRDFTFRDDTNATKVVIINQALAEALWPHQSVLSRRVFYGNTAYEVVGVVGNAYRWEADTPFQPGLYFCFLQGALPGDPHLLLRVNGPMTPLRSAVAALVRQADPGHQPSLVKPYSELMLRAFVKQRTLAWILELASAVGLALVSMGLYGTLSYYVAQRTREIGIRMALGASRTQMLGAMLRRGILLAGFGILVGLSLSLAAARLLNSFLYGVKPTDPLTWSAVSVLVLGVAALACLFPAWRAANIHPMEALRYE